VPADVLALDWARFPAGYRRAEAEKIAANP